MADYDLRQSRTLSEISVSLLEKMQRRIRSISACFEFSVCIDSDNITTHRENNREKAELSTRRVTFNYQDETLNPSRGESKSNLDVTIRDQFNDAGLRFRDKIRASR